MVWDISGLQPGTKSLRTKEDMQDYISAFNRDDFDHYTRYYHPKCKMNFAMLTEKTLQGYMNWVGPMHENIQETLGPKRVSFDVDGDYVAIEFHTKFTTKHGHSEDNFLGRWGPVYTEDGPLVKMYVWYSLDKDGYIVELNADSSLMQAAPAKK